ncbi:DNA-directed RNA polymerase subunit D [Candidatus Woesearchaeota archaeon]|jgi:DNA-directed RNA polymerase subunit D|nr:DNA-directed RNA polymerase subunit D [Candidatus Woesearchaeota archaeon]
MKVEKINFDKKNDKISFLLKGVNESFVNVIRRIITEEVPTLAIEDVEIKENSSGLYDEMLALRLGLVPIKTDLKSYTFKEGCKCEGAGCARCELKMAMKVSKKGYVYADSAVSKDPKCKFVYNMPITKILPKQKVELQMTAILGRGKDHAKWSPGWGFYKKEPVITIGNVKDAEKVANVCPKGIFNAKGGKLALNKDKVYDCHLCNACVDLDDVKLEDTDNYIFTLESWGQLSCKDVLTTSMSILLEKLDQLGANLK